MKMIMLQMNPQNWKQVLKGKKVMQINKRRPKEEPPYCILVCLKGKGVVGQFTCNEIIEMCGDHGESKAEGRNHGSRYRSEGDSVTKKTIKKALYLTTKDKLDITPTNLKG